MQLQLLVAVLELHSEAHVLPMGVFHNHEGVFVKQAHVEVEVVVLLSAFLVLLNFVPDFIG